MIIYNKIANGANTAIGRFETPIKMIIENESDLLSRKGGICSALFNIEKSSHFGETLVTRRDFDVFQAAADGAGAELDIIGETGRKFIEHVQYMKEFIITAEMMEDSQNGIAAEAKRRAENFARAYYKTVNTLCAYALANGMNETVEYAKSNLDLTTADGLPLFNAYHKYGEGNDKSTQSNYYWGDIFSTGASGSRVSSCEVFEEALTELSYKLRSMKGENGEILGYTADTIVLPGNHFVAETIVKKVCGSVGTTGSANNDINLHFGNWNIVIMPTWTPQLRSCMIMSSEANKSLSGNMFFNRVPLTVTNWVDHHTGNYIWNGRCRFGIGFGSYKHILLAVDSSEAVEGATEL